MRIRSASRVYIVNDENQAGDAGEQTRIGRIKAFLGKYFCGFCGTMPTIALVLFAILIILLVLSIIPLAIFALMGGSSSALHSNLIRSSQVYHNEPPIRMSNNTSWVFDKTDEFEGFEKSSTLLLVPHNITSCSHNGFACDSTPSIVIGRNQRCDGKHDCPDGSDEVDCHSCLTSFHCPARNGSNQLLCLRGDSLCDGSKHCPMGEDEQFCRKDCLAGEYKCKSFDRCVPEAFRCDGNDHCPLGDDESECSVCNGGAKFCEATKTCIPIWNLCNGVAECPDGSDEMDCDCKSCSSDSTALCTGSDKKMCIQKSMVCNGVPQCPVGEDEQGCAGKCHDVADVIPHHEDVHCEDGTHYTWKYACSGLYPQCNSACKQCNEEMAFQCKDKSACVHRSRVCNGVADCLDGSDEANCTAAQKLCDSEEKRCNAFKDCEDGRDEVGCKSCKNDAFHCETGDKCVHSHERCDGIAQCADGSDEENCTCTECSVHPFRMYTCEHGNRCFRSNDVCGPHTRCPNPTRLDKMFCATRNHQFF